MCTWFLSGIAMMYYPWPALTESRQLAILEPLNLAPSDSVIGFAAAAQRGDAITSARLLRRNGRLMYELSREEREHAEPVALVDALTGAPLTPLSRDAAISAASLLAPAGAHEQHTDLLREGDRYMMSHEYARFFPAYVVHFDDPAGTAVYVSRERGKLFGVVTSRTRFTTWVGVVPHWLYFQWLYSRLALWTWINLLLPSAALIVAITGIIFGTTQLFPSPRNGTLRLSEYRGVSNWHHVTGVVFGLMVVTWTLSGVLKLLGGSNEPRPGQADSVRGGALAWQSVRMSAFQAATSSASAPASASAAATTASEPIVAIDLVQLDGRAGYDVRTHDGREVWIDAVTGERRGELSARDATAAAQRVMSRGAHVTALVRIDESDTYYYARRGREVHLPAWRVAFDDAAHSVVYLNTVTGEPVGFVDDDTRAWRWWRDALHNFDFAAVNNRRPLWVAIVLPLMLGGAILSVTGIWLVVRRLRRIARRMGCQS